MIRNARIALTRIAIVLAGVAALAVAIPHLAAPAAPLPLTLTDAHGWTPTATLDTAQVEQGEPVPADPAPADVPSTFDDVKALYPLLARMADAGSPDVIRADDTDAPELSECVIVVGDTSVLVCSDGFTSQS